MTSSKFVSRKIQERSPIALQTTLKVVRLTILRLFLIDFTWYDSNQQVWVKCQYLEHFKEIITLWEGNRHMNPTQPL